MSSRQDVPSECWHVTGCAVCRQRTGNDFASETDKIVEDRVSRHLVTPRWTVKVTQATLGQLHTGQVLTYMGFTSKA